MMEVKFDSEEEYEDIIMVAFRYALPRCGYAPYQVSTHIQTHIKTFSDTFLRQVIDMIVEHQRCEIARLVRYSTRLSDIYNEWSSLKEALKGELEARDKFSEIFG